MWHYNNNLRVSLWSLGNVDMLYIKIELQSSVVNTLESLKDIAVVTISEYLDARGKAP